MSARPVTFTWPLLVMLSVVPVSSASTKRGATKGTRPCVSTVARCDCSMPTSESLVRIWFTPVASVSALKLLFSVTPVGAAAASVSVRSVFRPASLVSAVATVAGFSACWIWVASTRAATAKPSWLPATDCNTVATSTPARKTCNASALRSPSCSAKSNGSSLSKSKVSASPKVWRTRAAAVA